ncbi:MAG: T9SS type A sorting domain-containing protein [bacterium]|nr:T9SS type A sorting domain-containing protein [bacterium]
MRFLILSIAFIFLLLPGKGSIIFASQDVVNLLPENNEIGNWTKSGIMSTAENETQLEALIDGAAPLYTSNGFVKCAFQNYKSSTDSLEVRIYDQTDSTGAKNVYNNTASGTGTPWTSNHAGTEARINETLLFDYRVDFRQDKFFVSITTHNKTQPDLDTLKLFALNISTAAVIGLEEKTQLLNPQNIKFSLNPSISSTTICYSIPAKTKVSLEIYDLTGRAVKAIVNEEKEAGAYNVVLNTKYLSSGVYFAKFITNNCIITKKLILI